MCSRRDEPRVSGHVGHLRRPPTPGGDPQLQNVTPYPAGASPSRRPRSSAGCSGTGSPRRACRAGSRRWPRREHLGRSLVERRHPVSGGVVRTQAGRRRPSGASRSSRTRSSCGCRRTCAGARAPGWPGNTIGSSGAWWRIAAVLDEVHADEVGARDRARPRLRLAARERDRPSTAAAAIAARPSPMNASPFTLSLPRLVLDASSHRAVRVLEGTLLSRRKHSVRVAPAVGAMPVSASRTIRSATSAVTSADPIAVGRTSTTSMPTRSSRAAISRHAQRRSPEVMPPGSGVPGPGRERGIEDVDVDGEEDRPAH